MEKNHRLLLKKFRLEIKRDTIPRNRNRKHIGSADTAHPSSIFVNALSARLLPNDERQMGLKF